MTAPPHDHAHDHPHDHPPHAHSLAAVVAHTHDAHAPEPVAADRGETTHRAAMVATPPAVCEFEPDRGRLEVLYRALSGHPGELVAYGDGDDTARLPETVHRLYLPDHAPIDEHHGSTRPEWYRVAVTHRALHQLLGTFALDLDADEPLFARLRPKAPEGVAPLTAVTRMFGRPAVAAELFATLEDLRIDAAASRLLPGLADAYRRACHEALHDRPPLSMLGARDALVEALVQFSLGASGVEAPTALLGPLSRVVTVARRLLDPGATVVSTVEATVRLYRVLVEVPARAAHRSVRAVAFDDLPTTSSPDDADLRDLSAPALDGEPSITFHPVPFRDAVGARYVTGDRESGLPLEHAVLRLATTEAIDDQPGAPDDDHDGRPTPGDPDAALRPGDGDAATHPDAPRPVVGPDDGAEHHPADGRLQAAGPGEYVYPEWDAVAGAYRERWCLLRATRAPAGPTRGRHRGALQRYGHLLPGLVAALERVQPAGRDIVLRRPHGDDLDLDACVEALLDLRAGTDPSDRIHADTQDRRRDVAVAFAVDLSGSTAEALPPDPAEPGRLVRVLDLQRDAVVLLAQALDRVGDAYGVYGFSGSGREDVRLTVVKDVDERRSPAVQRRIEGLRPDHTTRMGPVIRHLTARLSVVDAATKVLLVVSDGRPYDIDYGQQYGEAATVGYALADTGRALEEARRAGVRPYLLSVDAGGADYLSRICDPREYHAIADARELPRALAELYVVARADAFRRREPAPA